jgi:hypothetical protein
MVNQQEVELGAHHLLAYEGLAQTRSILCSLLSKTETAGRLQKPAISFGVATAGAHQLRPPESFDPFLTKGSNSPVSGVRKCSPEGWRLQDHPSETGGLLPIGSPFSKEAQLSLSDNPPWSFTPF